MAFVADIPSEDFRVVEVQPGESIECRLAYRVRASAEEDFVTTWFLGGLRGEPRDRNEANNEVTLTFRFKALPLPAVSSAVSMTVLCIALAFLATHSMSVMRR